MRERSYASVISPDPEEPDDEPEHHEGGEDAHERGHSSALAVDRVAARSRKNVTEFLTSPGWSA